MVYDVLVVGGGIVGLATAFKTLEKNPNLKLALLEKEDVLCKHQTGNNSGVIHSGLYYKPGSLKATNCINGYNMLLDFCKKEQIEYELCGKVVVATQEFQKPLLALYKSQSDFVQPESAKNEVVSFVSRGLEDLSISRSKEKFDWGVDIPWDDSHVTYVWFDALLNYITALGYGEDETLLKRYWPANVQVVGKDILRFHAVIWPAMLMAAGLEPPKQIFGHGWLLVGGEKMSKSKLTGIAPEQITDVFGSDAFRYYFMRAISFGSDGSFSWEDLSARYQAELANGFGNLASRVVSMVEKYFDSSLPEASDYTEPEKQLIAIAQAAALNADRAMDRGAIHEAIAASWTLVDELNNYITQQEPWKVAKDEDQKQRLATILYASAEGLRILSVLLAPIMPKATAKLFAAIWPGKNLSEQTIADAAQWGGLPAGVKFSKLESLFPRIEQE